MGCDRTNRKERPGAGEERVAEGSVGRRRGGGDDAAFVSVDTKTGKFGELRDEKEGRGDNLDGGGSEGEIIRKGIRRDTRESGDTREQRVLGDDEEERRERATLFDTPKNVDPVGEVPSEGGGNPNILEGSFDKVNEPKWEPGAGQDLEGPGVVNGVKGRGGVEKEDETLGTVLDPSKEVVVDTDSVIHPVLSGKKPLLSWVNQGRNSRHYDVSHGGSKDAVVRVGNADRSGVRH